LKTWIAILLLVATGAAAPAEPDPRVAVWSKVLPERAEVLKLTGDAARGESVFAICRGCHRAGALGRPDGSYPRLAGQHASVLIKQMTDVRAGLRSNPKMLPFADEHELTPQDIADVAVYLQALPVPPSQSHGPGDNLDRAAVLYRHDCATCHGAHGMGDAEKLYPRLSGQHFRYLLRAGRMIRDGQRHNAHPEMVDAIARYTDDDLSAVADLVSRMAVEDLGK
jgi:cytochrome c553